MLTILQVTPELETGGVERTTIDIAAAVKQAGGRALVASRGGRMAEELAAVGGELVAMPVHSKNPARMLANALAIMRLARRARVDVIHARSRAPAWSALWAARLGQRPFVTTYHGTYKAKTGLKRFYNSVMARGDHVIANSGFIAARIASEYPDLAPELTVVPRGVDTERFDPAAVRADRVAALRDAWGLDGGAPGAVVLLPGRLTAWKGQEVAIKAFARLAERANAPPAHLVLAGDDQGRAGYRNQLLNLIESRKLQGRAHLVGHCADMPAAYAASDIVLSASVEPEAFGRVAVEAQCMGRPVIATDHGGARETVVEGEGGVLVAPGDPAALAEGLATLLEAGATARMTMGERGAARVRREFSVQAMQAATLAVYEKAAGSV